MSGSVKSGAHSGGRGSGGGGERRSGRARCASNPSEFYIWSQPKPPFVQDIVISDDPMTSMIQSYVSAVPMVDPRPPLISDPARDSNSNSNFVHTKKRSSNNSGGRTSGGKAVTAYTDPCDEGQAEIKTKKARSGGSCLGDQLIDQERKAQADGDHAQEMKEVQADGDCEQEMEKIQADGDREQEMEKIQADGDREQEMKKIQADGDREQEMKKIQADGDHAQEMKEVQADGDREQEMEKIQADGDRDQEVVRVESNIISPPSLPLVATNRSMILNIDEEEDKENEIKDEVDLNKRVSKGRKKASGSSARSSKAKPQGDEPREGEDGKKRSTRGSGKSSGARSMIQLELAPVEAPELMPSSSHREVHEASSFSLAAVNNTANAPLFRPAFGIRGPRNFKPPSSTLSGSVGAHQISPAPPPASDCVGHKVPGLRKKPRNY